MLGGDQEHVSLDARVLIDPFVSTTRRVGGRIVVKQDDHNIHPSRRGTRIASSVGCVRSRETKGRRNVAYGRRRR